MPDVSPLPPYSAPLSLEPGPDRRLLLLCDHATNALPEEYGLLGLPAEEFRRHIAYDIGAAAVTRGLAHRLGATAVYTGFSRLLIDPNRGSDDPTLVMRLSDGAVVPGNARIDAAGIAERTRRFHQPYHDAIERWLDETLADGTVPVIVAIHSFTPFWKAFARPWHAAVLWDVDPRMAQPLIAGLRDEAGIVVGDNEPYDGALQNDTMYRHATMRGLAHALIEVRQDLISDEVGVEEWADRLANVLAPLVADPSLHRIEHRGSRADVGHRDVRRPGKETT
jgi:predicted N-formylglutamate amidohydrolase